MLIGIQQLVYPHNHIDMQHSFILLLDITIEQNSHHFQPFDCQVRFFLDMSLALHHEKHNEDLEECPRKPVEVVLHVTLKHSSE